jgi:hypothetical protein
MTGEGDQTTAELYYDEEEIAENRNENGGQLRVEPSLLLAGGGGEQWQEE